MDQGETRPAPFKPGDGLEASRLNEWAEYTAGTPLEVAGGLEASTGGGGRTMRLPRRRKIMAVLSGATSPYSWTQKVNSALGTLANGPLSGTTNAYEVDGTSGLSGRVVRLVPDGRGNYNFKNKCCDGGGSDPDPECYCWTEGTAPETLAWTYVAKRADGLGGFVTLGTTSGTLTWTTAVEFGTTPCTPFGTPPIPGWIGEFDYYTTGLPTVDDDFPPVYVPHCSTIKQDGQAFLTEYCRWLAVLCDETTYDQPTGSGNPPSRLQLLYTIAGTFETCIRHDLYNWSNPDRYNVASNSGVDDVIDTCDPFTLQITYFDGSILTITE